MNIRAEAPSGEFVTIVAFVVKQDQTYAITKLDSGRLTEYRINELIVLD